MMPPPCDIPESLRSRVLAVFGERGATWLSTLPELLASCTAQWSIEIEPPFPGLTYHYVCPVRQSDGTPAVLKLGVPNPELTSEAEALQLVQGAGAARLLNADIEAGALLLERLLPGESLVALVRNGRDEEATAIACEVMKAFWKPLPAGHRFHTLPDWCGGFARHQQRFDGSGPLPAVQFSMAHEMLKELLASSPAPVLLHGDLHHANILSTERKHWLAIDPKGIAGEPAFEVGTFLRNPLPELLDLPDPRRTLSRRLDIFSERLGIDRDRLRDWGVVQAVLSAVWSVEDNEAGWETTLEIASLLQDA